MTSKDGKNWWTFSIDNEVRAHHSLLGGSMEVNPTLSDGRRLLDYHTYLKLDKLLQCQKPTSMIPDERVFIITHQLFELVFKMMIFDMAVVVQTLETVLTNSGTARELLCACTTDEALWLPALTAAARLKFASKEMLPALTHYLSKEEGEEETFSSTEFQRFRDNLSPASGFQTAQFRLIQQALGKSNLLEIRLFPANEYWQSYEMKEGQPVAVTHPLILGKQRHIANPAGKRSSHARVAMLDNIMHRVLGRLSSLDTEASFSQPIEKIKESQMLRVIDVFGNIMENHMHKYNKNAFLDAEFKQRQLSAQEIFYADAMRVMKRENRRRALFQSARHGFLYLRSAEPNAPLLKVIECLIATDESIHNLNDKNSFLSLHLKMAKDHMYDLQACSEQAEEPGMVKSTGGGGIPYLGFMRKMLIPLFPSLVACRI